MIGGTLLVTSVEDVQWVLLSPTQRQSYKLSVYGQLLTVPKTGPVFCGHTSSFARFFVQTYSQSLKYILFTKYPLFSECCWFLLQGGVTNLVSMDSCWPYLLPHDPSYGVTRALREVFRANLNPRLISFQPNMRSLASVDGYFSKVQLPSWCLWLAIDHTYYHIPGVMCLHVFSCLCPSIFGDFTSSCEEFMYLTCFQYCCLPILSCVGLCRHLLQHQL